MDPRTGSERTAPRRTSQIMDPDGRGTHRASTGAGLSSFYLSPSRRESLGEIEHFGYGHDDLSPQISASTLQSAPSTAGAPTMGYRISARDADYDATDEETGGTKHKRRFDNAQECPIARREHIAKVHGVERSTIDKIPKYKKTWDHIMGNRSGAQLVFDTTADMNDGLDSRRPRLRSGGPSTPTFSPFTFGDRVRNPQPGEEGSQSNTIIDGEFTVGRDMNICTVHNFHVQYAHHGAQYTHLDHLSSPESTPLCPYMLSSEPESANALRKTYHHRRGSEPSNPSEPRSSNGYPLVTIADDNPIQRQAEHATCTLRPPSQGSGSLERSNAPPVYHHQPLPIPSYWTLIIAGRDGPPIFVLSIGLLVVATGVASFLAGLRQCVCTEL